MQTMKEFLTGEGLDVPKGAATTKWFEEHKLSIFTDCAACGNMKVPILRAYIDDDGKTYCPDCAAAKTIAEEKPASGFSAAGEIERQPRHMCGDE